MATVLGLVATLAGPSIQPQTVRQGGPETEKYQDFHSPMVIETVFLIADRRNWPPNDKTWITNEQYGRLQFFRCDQVSLVSLGMNAAEVPGGRVEVHVGVNLFNPDGSNDKKVALHFEVINGDRVDGTFDLDPVKVKEGDRVAKTIKATLPLTALKAKPLTKLRITMTTWNYYREH